MNFDHLAPFYRVLELITARGKMPRGEFDLLVTNFFPNVFQTTAWP